MSATVGLLQEILREVDVKVPRAELNSWSPSDRSRAENWAISTHYRQTDKSVKIPPMPLVLLPFVRKHQKGPAR